jgi:hypothetical protein
VFALATGSAQGDVPSHELVAINAAAADALSLAIVDAVVAAAAHPRGAAAGVGAGAVAGAGTGADAPAAPRPAALREVAPEMVHAWEAQTTGA